jgi:SAM-dependent methyltransferase
MLVRSKDNHDPPPTRFAEPDGHRTLAHPYDEEYFQRHCGPRPCVKTDQEWLAFYSHVADNIVRALSPRTVFDAGCGIGFLVEALWERSVEAHGRDISEFAISQVRRDVQPWCTVGSITEPIVGKYDLITCIEVLEHLEPDDASLAIQNITAATTRVLFSSSPCDFAEPTHVNVRPPIYWLHEFAKCAFRPVLNFDATFLTPWALLFERTEDPVPERELLAAAELVRARIQVDDAHKHLATANAKIADLEARLSELSNATTLLATAEQTISHLKQQISEVQQHADDAINNFTQQLALAQEDAGNLRARLQALVDEKIALQRALRQDDTLRQKLEQQIARSAQLEAELNLIRESTTWRATYPLRWALAQLPGPLRATLHNVFQPSTLQWLSATAVLQRASTTFPGISRITRHAMPISRPAPKLRPGTFVPLFAQVEPISLFRTRDILPTINMVTDSISPGSLFGGVATAIIISALLAERQHARLRVVTRTEPGNAATVHELLRAHEIDFRGPIQLLHVPPGTSQAIPVADMDLFLTTSWWTTTAVLPTAGHHRTVYLLQEDERAFYPRSDERLRCSEVLNDPDLRLIINTHLLLTYLASGPEPIRGIRQRATVFEPAFPESIYYDDSIARARDRKRTFLFYGRPLNLRNLYWRGMEAIEAAVLAGILDSRDWKFVFVGKDLPVPSLPGEPEWSNYENLPWDQYAQLVRSAHVGMSLIDTPHPSYPPLDLAACGAVAVTNTFGDFKKELTQYSKNIITAPPTIAGLVAAIKEAILLSEDTSTRLANYRNAGLCRHWKDSLTTTIDDVLSWFVKP